MGVSRLAFAFVSALLIAAFAAPVAAADFTFTIPLDGSDNQTIVEDDGNLGNGSIQIRSGNGTFATQTFANPTGTLLISSSGDGFENVVLARLDSGFSANVVVSGSTGDEVVLVQATPAGAGTTVAGAGGNDIMVVNSQSDNSGHLNDIAGVLTFDGGTGSNGLRVGDFGGTTPNSNVVITSASISGFAGPTDATTIHYGGVNDTYLVNGSNTVGDTVTVESKPSGSTLFFLAHGGNDTLVGPAAGATFAVTAPSEGGITGLVETFFSVENLRGGSGVDTFAFAPGGSMPGTIDGGGNTDSLDYSSYGTPVSVNLGSNAPSLAASLTGDQEVPARPNTASGSAALTYNNVTHAFDIAVTVTGIAPSQVSGFHIHRAPVSVNGPIVVDFTGAGLIPTADGFSFTATAVPLDALHEAPLLAGGMYVDIHTPTFPGGAIRGQIHASSVLTAAPGTATATAGISNIEDATGGAGSFIVGATAFGDSLVGTLGVNQLVGNSGNDALVGSRGSDIVQGGAGADLLLWSSGDGSDVVDGGTESDTLQLDGVDTEDFFNVLQGIGGRLTVERFSPAPSELDVGTTENVFLNGHGGADFFGSSTLSTVLDLQRVDLNGFAGADDYGLLPADTVSLFPKGFSGDDTVRIGPSSGSISVDGGEGLDTIGAEVDTDYTLTNTLLSSPFHFAVLAGIERAELTGGPSNNTFDASGFSGTTLVEARGGNDLVFGGAGVDDVRAGAGDDEVDGNLGNDLLRGGPGDDVLDGGGGIDLVTENANVDFELENTSLVGIGLDELVSIEEAALTGRSGDNTFTVSGWTGVASLDGGGGIGDLVESRNDADFTLTSSLLTRSSGGTFMLAGIEEALLSGGLGNNTLAAGGFGGDATLLGKGGNDDFVVGPGDDTVTGGSGTDRVSATGNVNFALTNAMLTGLGEDVLVGIERATLTGGSSTNTIDAKTFSGAVILSGQGGADVLHGGPSGDTLTGGSGADTMNGNNGNDVFKAAGDGAVDNVNGGGGTDSCTCDATDVKTSIP